MQLPLNLRLLGFEESKQVLLHAEPLCDAERLLGLLYRLGPQLCAVDELSDPHAEGCGYDLHVGWLTFGLQLVSVYAPL